LEISEAQRLKAKQMVGTMCENCHHPTASPDDRLAPPLEIAKRNYLAISDDKADFVNSVTKFVIAPSKEKAQLHSDVEEFGVMDPLGYSEAEIRAIAIYIYETELEKPDWLK
tara:strand:- start:30055 stop:30390 length:336 start_codon:yes stop_codon:yes gene_type:complete